MITTEVQYRETRRHLRRFEEALRNLESRHPQQGRTGLAQLEIDAVRAQAGDLRAEMDEFEHRHQRAQSGTSPG